MILRLAEADRETCGGKAGALGALLRAGLPVPDGFVVPFAVYRATVGDLDLGAVMDDPCGAEVVRSAMEARPLPDHLLEALRSGLGALGDPPVAVRSSAGNEDTARTSAAGQHATVLAVHDAAEVARAVRACWASLFSPGAHAYREASGDAGTREQLVMGVLVQRHVDAAVSGVMFTSGDPGGATEIEASWGLGPSVVGGTVSPDSFRVAPDGTVSRSLGDKRTRLDRQGEQVRMRDVPAHDRALPTLDDATAGRLARLGQRITAVLGGAQDVEWAIADGRPWVLQARPVTVEPPPALPPRSPAGPLLDLPGTLTGTPGSRGTATGTARVVRGPGDFGHVEPGDILVCPWTDPSWTPLLRLVAGVVTETGGALSHAAIVAREQRIPAVLGVPDATTRLHDVETLTIDGSAGTVTRHP